MALKTAEKRSCGQTQGFVHDSHADFQTATVLLYGQEETVQFLCLDLLWGQGLYQELRFVLVVHEGSYSILVSMDLTLPATDIIRLYGYLFKIESMFREMKQVTHTFGYRFWSKSMPKLNRFLKKKEAHPLETITNEHDRQRIQKTFQAIEGFVMCQCIAMGLLQLVALRFSGRTSGLFFRYLRTPSTPWSPRPRLPLIYVSLFFACLLKIHTYP